jgi:hypothetical protein
MTKDETMTVWEESGSYSFRDIKGVLCGLSNFMYTCGILIGVNGYSYERRYCFETAQEAVDALSDYEDTSIHPTGNWIKCKGIMKGKAIDLLNPELKD